ncbi:hypothetical protein BJ322DRAFT_1102553 [Thelephora terrestris]|uniref:Uncharacterized protein n=1 Tax=Thelephora terrestris TaxID=56493 RepID=A0A9P6HPH1_9AGAM|nr:hypothetical protein BJ322DRAFT_1102553 [Thelephora terrestris]
MDKQQHNYYLHNKVVKNQIQNQYYHDPYNEYIGRYASYINQHADYFDEHVNFDATIVHRRAKTNPAQTSRAAQTGGRSSQVCPRKVEEDEKTGQGTRRLLIGTLPISVRGLSRFASSFASLLSSH